jgi:NAD(P)-dependent dehydrogenase (short-subunit alcohol dehydrogenase family)
LSKVEGKVCVVTGAGSGIGRALAVELARRGASGIAISDVNEESAQETAALIGSSGGVEVHSSALDVSDREAFANYAASVAEHFGVVHQIYNNAGIADSEPVDQFDYDRYERVLNINLWGVIYGTKEFLPHLIASGDGHIVNVSSLNGIMAQAGLSAYCASKFGVRGFTESVALDLKEEGHPVRATVIHPGGVKTGIASSALAWAKQSGREVTAEQEDRARFYNEKLLKMDPPRAAAIIVDGVEANRPRVLVGSDARLMDTVIRIAPRRWPTFFSLLQRRFEKEFESRQGK